MPLLLLRSLLHLPTLCSSQNPKSPSSNPPLILRFRTSPRQIAQYLKTLGIRASPHSPESLDWILSAVNYLKSKGFSDEHFPRLSSLCPRIFTADIDRNLAPFFAFVANDLAATPEQARDMIIRCPEILTTNVEFRLRPTLFFLRELGIKNLNLPSNLNANLLNTPVDKLASRIRFLECLGLSYEESTGICARFPTIFRYSEGNNLKPKFEYLVYEMGRSVEEVKRFPQYFGFDLKKRIAPRHSHLKQRNVQIPLNWMLPPTDKKFYARWK
ncbi:hypothetical protein AXF42_Ash013469 [Apostasia shenzhenica]|uniref:Uncharacterized protein n=1 Tax=Apostasia shenzhenica TaxID=1088818 RepID=A0A2I0A4B1_9ASPA|nr:hypothetical protein AXF42_Ash013469 [Apostasia shenzhenica]